MLEKEIETEFVNWLKTTGYRSYKLDATGGKGRPDRLVLLPRGRSILIEFKTEKGTQSPHQRREHRRLSCLGHVVYTCRSALKAVEVCNHFLEMDSKT